MKKHLFILLLLIVGASAYADLWTGETPVAGQSYYLFNKGANSFIIINGNGAPENSSTPMLFTLTEGLDGTDLQYSFDGTNYYLYQSAGTYGYCQDGNTSVQSGRSTSTMKSYGDSYRWKIKSYGDGYQIYSNHKYNEEFWSKKHRSDTDRYIAYNGSEYSCSKNNSEYNTDNGTWLFISEAQYNERKNYEDFSSEMTDTWEGATGAWNGGAERYNGNDNAFAVGDVLTQTIENLENGYYEIQFYTFENWADWNESANLAVGDNICEAFANEAKYSLTSIRSKGDRSFDENTLVTMICEVTTGNLTYGIRNIAEGGNWAVCKAKSLTYLGDTKVNMQVSGTAKYGTFCAPFDVALPTGVKAYAVVKGDGNWVELTDESNSVSAGTPVVLALEGSTTIAKDYYNNAVAAENNDGILKGVYTKTAVSPNDGNYLLQYKNSKASFHLVTAEGLNVGAYRCYLHLDGVNGARIALGEDDETAIESLQTEAQSKKDGKYLVGNRIVIVKAGKAYNQNGQIIK